MHANCASTYAVKVTWCNYQQTTNYHQLHMAISPWDGKLNTLLFLIYFFFFVFGVYSFSHTNDVFIPEGFQSHQITMALPLIRHNRTLAGGERWRKEPGEHILYYLVKSGLHWVIMFCLDIMLPIISRGLLQIKINQKKANKAFTSMCPTAVGYLGSTPAFLYKINRVWEKSAIT